MPTITLSHVFYFVLGCLASYRLGLMLSEETGPFFMFRKARQVPSKRSSFREGIACVWCVTVWWAVIPPTFFCMRGWVPWIEWPLWWMATAAGALCLNQQFTGPKP